MPLARTFRSALIFVRVRVGGLDHDAVRELVVSAADVPVAEGRRGAPGYDGPLTAGRRAARAADVGPLTPGHECAGRV